MQVYPSIDAKLREFIARQRIFFTASAASDTRVNVSPRGTDALAILDERTVAYLDRTGSGAETAAHINAGGQLTMMFCAFEGPPNILRLYGRGEQLTRRDKRYWELLKSAFGGEEPLGARQIVLLHVERVQTSCGYGVPLFEYQGERPSLDNWSRAKGEEGLQAYWRNENAVSIDGLPTRLVSVIFEFFPKRRQNASSRFDVFDRKPLREPVDLGGVSADGGVVSLLALAGEN